MLCHTCSKLNILAKASQSKRIFGQAEKTVPKTQLGRSPMELICRCCCCLGLMQNQSLARLPIRNPAPGHGTPREHVQAAGKLAINTKTESLRMSHQQKITMTITVVSPRICENIAYLGILHFAIPFLLTCLEPKGYATAPSPSSIISSSCPRLRDGNQSDK